MLNKNTKIYIAGHNGMVGSACIRKLNSEGYKNIYTLSSEKLDLRNQLEVEKFIHKTKPDIIIDAAARVGGILANNTYPYEFLMDNMLIQNNLIRSAHNNNINKFIFLGSSCIYPKFSKQPIKEEYLLKSELEPTNEWYAIAKISGIKLVEALRKEYNRDYVALMPTNLYGINDNFDLETSHVLPAMIRKFHDAKTANINTVELWGDGSPYREFLNVEDLAEAVYLAMNKSFKNYIYNVGSSIEISIMELANLIKNIVGFEGEIIWDKSKPNGTPRKIMDSSLFNNIGWKPKIDLKRGIEDTYKWYKNNLK